MPCSVYSAAVTKCKKISFFCVCCQNELWAVSVAMGLSLPSIEEKFSTFDSRYKVLANEIFLAGHSCSYQSTIGHRITGMLQSLPGGGGGH